MKNLNKYEAKMDKLINKIIAGDYNFSKPTEIFQMLTLSTIGIYNRTKDWIVEALENPEGNLEDIKDYEKLNFSDIRNLIYSLLSSIPIQVSRKLEGLQDGVDFVHSVIKIFNKYDNNEDRRVKLTTLLHKNKNLNDKLIESFIVLEEIERWLETATKVIKKEV